MGWMVYEALSMLTYTGWPLEPLSIGLVSHVAYALHGG